MTNLLLSLLLITAISLMALLTYVLRSVDEANRIFDADKATAQSLSESTSYLKKAKYYIYIPAGFLAFVAVCVWQEQRYEKEFALKTVRKMPSRNSIRPKFGLHPTPSV